MTAGMTILKEDAVKNTGAGIRFMTSNPVVPLTSFKELSNLVEVSEPQFSYL